MHRPTLAELLQRARSSWYVILFILLFAAVDWIAHHDPVIAFLGAIIAIAAVLTWPDVAARLHVDRLLAKVPPLARAALIALPGLAFIALRERGGLVAVVTLAAVVGLAVFGPALDRRLAGFYRGRDAVPRAGRMVAAPVLALLVAGAIAAPARGAASVSPVLLVLAALASTAIGFLLLREGKEA